VLIEAVLKLPDQRLIQFSVAGGTIGNVLNVGNLTIISGLRLKMIEEGRDFHSNPLNADNLDFVIQYLYLEATVSNEVNYLGKDLIGISLIVTNATNPDGSQLPNIVVINLSHGNIEFVTNPAGNRLQYLPLTFQRQVFRQAKTNLTYTNIHNL
jgi:hypothetical protein